MINEAAHNGWAMRGLNLRQFKDVPMSVRATGHLAAYEPRSITPEPRPTQGALFDVPAATGARRRGEEVAAAAEQRRQERLAVEREKRLARLF